MPLKTSELPVAYRLTGATLWNTDGITVDHDLVIKNGMVEAIIPANSPNFGELPRQEALGTLIPIGVDPQVHLRVPGQPEKETPDTGLWAALRGGVGALLTMPNTKPVIDDPSVCDLAIDSLKNAMEKTGVEVFLSAAITKGEKGIDSVDYSALAKWGVKAFTDDGLGVASDEIMGRVFAASEATGLPVLQHAEVPGHKGVLAPSTLQAKLGIPAYPESAETEMVERDLRVLQQYPRARYHVLHISAAKTIDLVKNARKKGFKVSAEVSPHHLYFSGEDIKEDNSSFKMNPPLRSPKDRESLQKALASGDIDFVATDHAPHETQVKTTNFKTSAYGTTGLETSLRVLLSLYSKGMLSPERLVDAFSTKPAEFLGIGDRYGRIAVGRPFKAVLVDPKAKPSEIQKSDLESLSNNNCFLGTSLSGKILGSFIGKRFYANH